MTYRALLIFIGVSALALAGLALVFAVRAVMRRARAGQRRVWFGLWFRAALIAGLVVVGMSNLGNLPPPQMVNHPAPAAASAIVAFIKGSRTVVGVSARDGATRWTRTLDGDGAIASLLRPAPDIILAVAPYQSVTALRVSDGAIRWNIPTPTSLRPQLVAMDGDRVVILSLPPASGTGTAYVRALDLTTGAQLWQTPLPATIKWPQALVVGDGLVFVAGSATSAETVSTPWVIAALGATDGALQWAATGPAIAGALLQVRAIFVMRGEVVVVPQVGPVTALRERDGAIAWAGTPDPKEPDNPPRIIAATADSDTIYLVWQPSHWATEPDGRSIQPTVWMVALTAGGALRWRTAISPTSTAWAALALSDGALLSGSSVTAEQAYGGYAPNGSLLTAYDPASGRVLWRDNTPRVGVSWDMSPQISPLGGSGAIYLMGIQSDPYVQDHFRCVIFCPGVAWLYAVNVHTGAPWWRARMGDAILTHLVF